MTLSHIDSILKGREEMESSLSTHCDTFNDIRTVKIAGSSLNDNFINKVKTWILSVLSLHSQRV